MVNHVADPCHELRQCNKDTGQMATIDQLIEEFIIENPVESEKAKTLVIGCMIYDKNKDGNCMLT